jgi:vacuolar-type H+-ATPase subunit E/Vma4
VEGKMKAEMEKRHAEIKKNIQEKMNFHVELLKRIDISTAEINQLNGALQEVEKVIATIFQREVDSKNSEAMVELW